MADIDLPVARDPLHWAKRAKTSAALTLVMVRYLKKDVRFKTIVEQHVKEGRLWFDDGVLKVGRAPRSNRWTA